MSVSSYCLSVSSPPVKLRDIFRLFLKILRDHNRKAGDINIIFCNDRYIRKLNRKYLKNSYSTDVLSFNLSDSDYALSGEIYVSVPCVRKNAVRFHTTVASEFVRVIIHGLLHMIDYQDDTDIRRKIMTFLENYYSKIYLDFLEK